MTALATKTSTSGAQAGGSAPKRAAQTLNRAHRVRVLGERDFLVVQGAPAERIAAVASRQRGRIARRQLLAIGITPSMLKPMLSNGLLHRRQQGVYAVGHIAPTEWGRETEALLASRPGAVLSHHTAAHLWGLRASHGGPVEVTVVGTAGAKRRGIKCHRTAGFHPRDVRFRDGLPVTSPARTLLDIAAELTPSQLGWALDEALGTHVMTKSQLAEMLERTTGQRGAGILKRLFRQRTTKGRTRSGLEKRFLALLRQADLPLPQVNFPLHGFLLDFYWPQHQVVVEIDSYLWHSSKSAFERDHRKDAVLKAHGLDSNRFSDEQLDNAPYAVIARVAERLAARKRAV